MLRKLVAVLAALAMFAGLAAAASADDITTDNTTDPITATKSVQVWVLATQDPTDPGKSPTCNIGNANDSLSMTASITSSNTAVATVDQPTMTFQTCGVAQTLTITVAAAAVCNQSATVTIAMQSVNPNDNAVKGAFNEEVLNVYVAGTNPTDPSCTGGGGSGTSICALPAAPAWAAALLKASNLKAKQTVTANYVSSVAQHMGPGTDFDGHGKSHQGPAFGDEYANAVRNYMVNTLGLNLVSVSDARLIRPGWDCAPLV